MAWKTWYHEAIFPPVCAPPQWVRGGGGGSAGSYSRTAAGSRTQLEAGDEQVHEIKKNQSLDKTVNIDISTKGGRTRGAQRKITMKRKRLRFDWFQDAGQIYSGKEQVRHQRHSAKIWRLILHVQLSSTPTLTFVELLSSEEKLWLTDENVITGSEWAGLHSLTVLSLDDVISQRLSWLKLTLVTDPSCPDNRDKTEMLRVTFVGDFTSCFAFEKEFY